MKENKKIKSKAGALAVAMLFLIMTAATTITSAVIVQQSQMMQQAQQITPTPEQQSQQAQSTPSTPPATQYFDEEVQYPNQLPTGTSSLTWIVARRAFNPWDFPQVIYDVGYSTMIMRLRDGPAHWWHFVGQVVITYDGQPDYTMPIDKWVNWDGHIVSGFDIYPVEYTDLGYFSTAHLTGIITKDLGAPEYKNRWFYGGQYYGCDPPALGGL